MEKFRTAIIFVPLLVIVGCYGLVKVIFNNQMRPDNSSLIPSPIAIMVQHENSIEISENWTNWETIKNNYKSNINSNAPKDENININRILLESLENKNIDLHKNDDNLTEKLTQISQISQKIYKLVRHHHWRKTNPEIKELEKIVNNLEITTLLDKKLSSKIYLLNKAIINRDTQMAMRNANQITFIIAEINKKIPVKIPTEIYLLNYYERELEIWSPTKNKPWLSKTSQNIHHTWLSIRPVVLAHGGKTQVDKFDKLLLSLNRAASSNDYTRVIPLLQKEQENLEKLFLSSSTKGN